MNWTPQIVTVLGSILGSGLIITLLQRRWSRADKKDDANVGATQGIILDGAKIREELWGKFGEQQGLINLLQAQQIDGIKERFELRLAIKSVEVKEEECRVQVELLKAQMARERDMRQ